MEREKTRTKTNRWINGQLVFISSAVFFFILCILAPFHRLLSLNLLECGALWKFYDMAKNVENVTFARTTALTSLLWASERSGESKLFHFIFIFCMWMHVYIKFQLVWLCQWHEISAMQTEECDCSFRSISSFFPIFSYFVCFFGRILSFSLRFPFDKLFQRICHIMLLKSWQMQDTEKSRLLIFSSSAIWTFIGPLEMYVCSHWIEFYHLIYLIYDMVKKIIVLFLPPSSHAL